MKHSVIRKLGAVLLISGIALGFTVHAAEHGAPDTMGGNAGPGSQKMKTPQEMDKKMSMMQESMLKMHEQMHKIMAAKNPQERERLTQEHRLLMRQHMQSMKDSGMMDQGMMGGAAKSGTGTGKDQKDDQGHKH